MLVLRLQMAGQLFLRFRCHRGGSPFKAY
jgi:hypothetical protein